MCETTPVSTITLEKSLASPALARDFVEQHTCPDHGAHGMAALQLLASELVTNAALYGAGPIEVTVSCDVDLMRVEVHDERPEGEVLSGGDGMGLLLVNKVAHDWGTTRTDHGKTVWGTVRTGVVPAQRPRSWESPRAVGRSAPSAPSARPARPAARRTVEA